MLRIRALLVVGAAISISGCATLSDTRTPTVEGYEAVRKSPMLPVTRNVTSFTEGLRCMDGLLGQYGSRTSLIFEDINDKTQKSAAGVTDMLIGAISQMTRRSGAIRAVAYSDDTKNLAGFMRLAGSKEAFQPENIPAYTIRGSVSQFDDNLAKKTSDAGVSLGPISRSFIGGGGAKSTSINMVALDLAVLRAQDFSLVPGVSAHNMAAILQEGWGIDAEVTYKKLGVNFMTSLSKSDGKTVALRNLVELAAIELVGKLNKLPYWRCLGIAANHPEVISEIDDWFESLSTAEKMRFFIQQFRAMGILPAGEENVEPAEFKLAFKVYSEVIGFPDNKSISLKLFRAHFETDPDVAGPKAAALYAEGRKKFITLELSLQPTRSRDEAVIAIASNNPAFVYCFLQDEYKNVLGVFPHGLKDPVPVPASRQILLRDLSGLAFVSHPKVDQSLVCFGTSVDRSQDLSALFATPAGTALQGGADINAIKAKLGAGLIQIADTRIRFVGHPAKVIDVSPLRKQ
jgi:hypothetical protein